MLGTKIAGLALSITPTVKQIDSTLKREETVCKARRKFRGHDMQTTRSELQELYTMLFEIEEYIRHPLFDHEIQAQLEVNLRALEAALYSTRATLRQMESDIDLLDEQTSEDLMGGQCAAGGRNGGIAARTQGLRSW
jgi:hypothetical protein